VTLLFRIQTSLRRQWDDPVARAPSFHDLPDFSMLVHAVYFWLRPDLSDADRATFVAWQPRLCALPSVTSGHWGVPAATDRPVIERSYSYALVLLFPDEAAEAAYQVDPEHEAFRAACGAFWTRVQIFDSISPA
jgi:Stress responsive A/B Barrel Domain